MTDLTKRLKLQRLMAGKYRDDNYGVEVARDPSCPIGKQWFITWDGGQPSGNYGTLVDADRMARQEVRHLQIKGTSQDFIESAMLTLEDPAGWLPDRVGGNGEIIMARAQVQALLAIAQELRANPPLRPARQPPPKGEDRSLPRSARGADTRGARAADGLREGPSTLRR